VIGSVNSTRSAAPGVEQAEHDRRDGQRLPRAHLNSGRMEAVTTARGRSPASEQGIASRISFRGRLWRRSIAVGTDARAARSPPGSTLSGRRTRAAPPRTAGSGSASDRDDLRRAASSEISRRSSPPTAVAADPEQNVGDGALYGPGALALGRGVEDASSSSPCRRRSGFRRPPAVSHAAVDLRLVGRGSSMTRPGDSSVPDSALRA